MPEWLKGVDCKSIGLAYAGSNPARPITYIVEEKNINHCFISFENKSGFKWGHGGIGRRSGLKIHWPFGP